MRDEQLKYKPYKSVYASMKSVVKSDGFKGLEKGLTGQMAYQFVFNGLRLATYQRFYDAGFLHADKNGHTSKVRCAIAGGACGLISSFFAAPFWAAKIKLQSQSKNKKYAVGYQYKHKSLIGALKNTYKYNGLKGFWKGYPAIALRDVSMSSIQMTTLSTVQEFLTQHKIFNQSILYTAVCSSFVSSFVSCIFTTPCDTVFTRMINQPLLLKGEGKYYKNVPDCFMKIIKTEGVLNGLYKGLFPNFLRMCPHQMISVTTWEYCKKWNKRN